MRDAFKVFAGSCHDNTQWKTLYFRFLPWNKRKRKERNQTIKRCQDDHKHSNYSFWLPNNVRDWISKLAVDNLENQSKRQKRIHARRVSGGWRKAGREGSRVRKNKTRDISPKIIESSQCIGRIYGGNSETDSHTSSKTGADWVPDWKSLCEIIRYSSKSGIAPGSGAV